MNTASDSDVTVPIEDTLDRIVNMIEVYPLAMDPGLVKAHDKLDRVVDMAFGAARQLITGEQRLEILFARYSAMILQHMVVGNDACRSRA